MSKGRLEAFSDGVFAIIITIMVLDLRAPASADPHTLVPLTPVFLCYALSFLFVAIYWNNHHHMLQASKQVDGRVLWANLHLLFWLSLVPFVTAWMGANHFATWPVAAYGVVLLLSGTAYFILLAFLDQPSTAANPCSPLRWGGITRPRSHFSPMCLPFPSRFSTPS